jgi:hypothetical protein
MIFIDSTMTDASKEWLKEKLYNQEVTVTFKKKDGSTRDMRCTLKEELIQPYERKENSAPKRQNDDVLPVFDLDKNEWRSFRLDSVKKVVIST